MNKKYLDLLYRSFDEDLSPDERRQLEEALKSSSDLRQEHALLSSMRHKIAAQSKQSFGTQFAESVIDQILHNEIQHNEYLSLNILARFVRPTAIAAAVLLSGIIAYNLSRSDYISWENALGVSDVSIEEIFDPASYLALENEE